MKKFLNYKRRDYKSVDERVYLRLFIYITVIYYGVNSGSKGLNTLGHKMFQWVILINKISVQDPLNLAV